MSTEPRDLVQVGWYFPDSCTPEDMTEREWEQERIFTMWTAVDEGGFSGEWAEKALPVFVDRAQAGSAPMSTEPRDDATVEIEHEGDDAG